MYGRAVLQEQAEKTQPRVSREVFTKKAGILVGSWILK
jgi:hypothetical protein